MYKKVKEGWAKHIDFIVVDVLCLLLSLTASILIRRGRSPVVFTRPYRNIMIVLIIMDVLVSILFGTLHNVMKRGVKREAVEMAKHAALVFAGITLYLFSTQSGATYSRIVVYLSGLLYIVTGTVARTLWKRFLLRHRREENRRAMLLITYEKSADYCIGALAGERADGVDITGVVLLDKKTGGGSVGGIDVVAGTDDAADYICREWVDEVFFHIPPDGAMPGELMKNCREMGVTMHLDLGAQSGDQSKQTVEVIGGRAVLTTGLSFATPGQLFLKRLVDIIGSLVGSAMTLVVLLVVGPIIKLKSPGPVIFKQERIGLNGRRFTLYKIRSMCMNAEAEKAKLQQENIMGDGMMFKMEHDPRIIGTRRLPDGTYKTGIGEFIRNTSLDEFPQFFNVLKGEMSLVGTRPPTVDEWEKYQYRHRARLAAKPGITGLWQVSGRNKITDFDEVVRLDTAYIRSWSPWLDVKILFKTVATVLRRKGAM